jgi:hypothetical protein
MESAITWASKAKLYGLSVYTAVRRKAGTASPMLAQQLTTEVRRIMTMKLNGENTYVEDGRVKLGRMDARLLPPNGHPTDCGDSSNTIASKCSARRCRSYPSGKTS